LDLEDGVWRARTVALEAAAGSRLTLAARQVAASEVD
jgi:hypothetical protein